MAKSLDCFLPHYETNHRRIQADIGITLAREADKIRKQKQLTWAEVMNGLLGKFVDDYKDKVSHEPQQVSLF